MNTLGFCVAGMRQPAEWRRGRQSEPAEWRGR